MILTTTCNREEFEAIRAAALERGIQVTAAPGFIYKKGNWVVGGTLETEKHFSARVRSLSLTPAEFIDSLQKEPGPNTSMFIVCESEDERASVIGWFLAKGYDAIDSLMPNGLAIQVIPAENKVRAVFAYIARQNAKEGYPIIDFDTFKTIAL